MALLAAPTSFIIAALPGLSGMELLDVTNLAMFSLVQAIVLAEAGLTASPAAIIAAVTTSFMYYLPGRGMRSI